MYGCSVMSPVVCIWLVVCLCFFSSRRRHTRCALVTGVQTCALPICLGPVDRHERVSTGSARRIQSGNEALRRRFLIAGGAINLPGKKQPTNSLHLKQIGRASCRERVCQYV